jgi:hypothetical protein
MRSLKRLKEMFLCRQMTYWLLFRDMEVDKALR